MHLRKEQSCLINLLKLEKILADEAGAVLVSQT